MTGFHLVDKSQTLENLIAWLLPDKAVHIFKIQNPISEMNELVEIQKTIPATIRKNKQGLVIEPSRSLFKVVVNNYKQQKRPSKEIVETMMEHHRTMPLQPAGYLKFPEYDWF